MSSNVRITAYLPDKSQYDISGITTNIKWSGDYKQSARKLEFSVLQGRYDQYIGNAYLPIGTFIYFYVDNKEVFRGMLFKKNVEGNSINYTVYDDGIRLLKIKGYYNFKDKNVTEACKQICKDYGIPAGNFPSVSTKITKVFIGVSLYEIIMTCYTEAYKDTGKKYMCCFKNGKINVEEKGVVTLALSFEEVMNISSSSFTESIEDMVNKIVVVNDKGEKVANYYKQNQIDAYGIFQEVIREQEGKDNKKEAEIKYKGIDKTCSLSGFGDTSCVTGTGVKVKDANTGMNGLFYIDADSHTWDNQGYKVDLNLNFENIMHEVQAGEDEREDTSSSSGGGGSTVTGGKEVTAEFTAYYPSNDPMQGGFKSANGEKLNPSTNTCAAPSTVPFGTKIQVKGTGTAKDGEVYRTNDRGGAIVVDKNGVYHIDLLMKDRTTAYAFGRRKGKAVIGVSVTSGGVGSGTAATGNAAKVVNLAKAQLGKRYVWGTEGPGTFDCSGLTSWCYKQIGITIPRVSRDQANHGKSVSRSNLQPGDLLFFSKYGSKTVSHVGMYVGGGKMVHAANPTKGVRTDDVTSGYYYTQFVNARRVL